MLASPQLRLLFTWPLVQRFSRVTAFISRPSSVASCLFGPCRCSPEASQGDELRGGFRRPGEGALGVQVQRQHGARHLHGSVPLERRHPPQRGPRHGMDHCCHGNLMSRLSPFIPGQRYLRGGKFDTHIYTQSPCSCHLPLHCCGILAEDIMM